MTAPVPTVDDYEAFIASGTTRILFLAVCEDYTSPTRAELDAGIDLSGGIAGLAGFSVTAAEAPTANLKERFTGSIPGKTSAEESSLDFWADRLARVGVDIRHLLPRDTNGVIIIMDGGDIEDGALDSFPVRVKARPLTRSLENEPTRVQVQFSITREPAELVAIPVAV